MSTEARLQPSRRRLFLAAQLVFAAAVVYFAARTLLAQWREVGKRSLELHPRVLPLVLSAVIVLVTYALLIEMWRIIMRAWGAEMKFGVAARIWFIASFGKYIPGKIWGLTAMGTMTQRAGVSPLVATGSSVIAYLLYIIAGLGVMLATGSRAVSATVPHATLIASLSIALFLIGMLVTPMLLPSLARIAGSVTGREIAEPRLPSSAIWIAAAGTALSWIMYGAAFHVFTIGVLGSAPGPTTSYIAVFTASYVVGFLALFAPAGIGVRELVMSSMMPLLGLATVPQAGVIAVTSRLWLTVLEVIPGLVFLAWGRRHENLKSELDGPAPR
jgi:hypothetical protein